MRSSATVDHPLDHTEQVGDWVILLQNLPLSTMPCLGAKMHVYKHINRIKFLAQYTHY